MKRLYVAVVDCVRRTTGRFACRRISYPAVALFFRVLVNNPVGRRRARIKAHRLLSLLDKAGISYDRGDIVVARAMIQHLFPWGYYRLAGCSRKELDRCVRSTGLEHLSLSLGDGRGVLLAANHHGPARVTPPYLRARGYRVHVLRRRNRHRSAERLGLRETPPPEDTAELCLENDDSPGFVRTMTRLRHLLQRGEIVFAALDGVAGHGVGAWVPLMGGTYCLRTGLATAAALSNAAVIPVHTALKTNGRIEIRFARPIVERRPDQTPLEYAEVIVRAYAQCLQNFITMEPGSVTVNQFNRLTAATESQPSSR